MLSLKDCQEYVVRVPNPDFLLQHLIACSSFHMGLASKIQAQMTFLYVVSAAILGSLWIFYDKLIALNNVYSWVLIILIIVSAIFLLTAIILVIRIFYLTRRKITPYSIERLVESFERDKKDNKDNNTAGETPLTDEQLSIRMGNLLSRDVPYSWAVVTSFQFLENGVMRLCSKAMLVYIIGGTLFLIFITLLVFFSIIPGENSI